MTLKSDKVSRREWFAGLAMMAITNAIARRQSAIPPETQEMIAKEAYALADAMTAASTRESEDE